MASSGALDKSDLNEVEIADKEHSDNASPSNEEIYLSELGEQELAAFDRKMLLKLDLVLVPLMAMLYLLAWLDRANIGNARVVSQGVRYRVTFADDRLFH